MRRVLLLILLSALYANSYAQFTDTKSFTFPQYLGWVNDFEGDFTQEEISDLKLMIAQFEKETTNEIAVVTLTDWAPFPTLNEYSLALANSWGIGKADVDNGILFIYSARSREVRIQVGTGLVERLTDEECQKILQECVYPNFRKERYFDGTKSAVERIITETR
jgi:uncharacterized protein